MPKDKLPSLAKNFAFSSIYQVLNVIAPLITAPYLSRVLGPAGLGIHSYTCSIQTYFSLFAALGTTYYGAKEISQNRNDVQMRSKLFWEIELVTVVTSCVSLIGWGIFILQSPQYKIYFLILTMNILATMFDITWFFTGLEKVDVVVLRNTVVKLLTVIFTLVLIKGQEDLVKYFLIYGGSALISSLATWVYIPGLTVHVKFSELKLKKHFKETVVYFIPTIATSVYTLLDRTLIGTITHSELENGYYAQAEKIINLAKTLVFSSISLVVGTRAAFLFAENRIEEVKQKTQNSIRYIFFTGAACAFGITAVAPIFVPVFFGEGYDAVVKLLYIFSPIIVVIGISNCLEAHYYIPSGRRAVSNRFIIVGAIVNLCMNLILIPLFNACGAAVASVIAEIIITILYVKGSDGFLLFKDLRSYIFKDLVAGILMLVGIRLFDVFVQIGIVYKLLIEIFLGSAIYIGVLIALKDVFITQMLKKIRRGF